MRLTFRSRARGRRRPGFDPLEDRRLLTVDLAGYAGASTGILEAGNTPGGGAGYSVADVGDVNGDGFDDFLIGAPTVATGPGGPSLGGGASSRAYLVFGSKGVNVPANIDFAALVAGQRTGDLGSLGNAFQVNPTNSQPGFAFDGLTFVTGLNPNTQLGASVAAAGDVNGDGYADFLIGAPGSADVNGQNAGTGRAYLVYGGPALGLRAGKTIDLDNPQNDPDLNIITFVSDQPGSRAGQALAGVGDINADGIPDVAVGAPHASIGGAIDSGAVYVVSGSFLRPARTSTIALAAVAVPNSGVPGVLFTGARAGDQAGSAIAPAGNFDGARGPADQPIGDLLIGAPGASSGAGAAYLVYGASDLSSRAQLNDGLATISLARVGVTDVLGSVFDGQSAGDRAGFSVASAGDFNGDGLGDILIGSPGYNGNAGRATLIAGRSPSGGGLIAGRFTLAGLPASVGTADFRGASAGDLAGFALASVGRINGDRFGEVAVGAPGFGGGSGAVYVIPGNLGLNGPLTLSPASIEGARIGGQTLVLSQPSGAKFLGSSLSGRASANGAGRTIDGDGLGDLVIGAAGYSLDPGRANAGGVFAVEGRSLPLGIPAGNRSRPPVDFDGDGKADISVYRPGSAQWLILQSTAGGLARAFGAANTDIPVPGDYDGDGKTDFAVYRPTTAQWLILYSGGGGRVISFGGPNIDQPVQADYDGDGKTDIAVYRPSTGQWFLLRSSAGPLAVSFGGANIDLAVPADYDGDGRADLAVYRPGTAQWFILRSTAGGEAVTFGAPNLDLPIPADYDGDGKTDIAVFRPTTSQWLMLQSSAGPKALTFGAPGIDRPVPADYDGDGRADLAVYRTTTAQWLIARSSAGGLVVPFGGPRLDLPLPVPRVFLRSSADLRAARVSALALDSGLTALAPMDLLADASPLGSKRRSTAH